MFQVFAVPTLSLLLSFVSFQAYALGVGEQAPCVELVNVAPDGTESSHCIREAKDQNQFKILEFFSATCHLCIENLPVLSDLANQVTSTTTTRLVGIDRDEQLIRGFIRNYSNLIHFEVALDTDRDAKRAYDITSTPTMFILDAKDQVIYKHVGLLSSKNVSEIILLVGQK